MVKDHNYITQVQEYKNYKMKKEKEIRDYFKEIDKLHISQEAKEMILWDKYGEEADLITK